MPPRHINVEAWHPDFGYTGKIRLLIHGLHECRGRFCCVHNPSVHPLSGSPRLWLIGEYKMMRVCRHGKAHPDPDDIAYKRDILGWDNAYIAQEQYHECDWCCTWDGPAPS